MKKLTLFLILGLPLFFSCGEDCNVGRTIYSFDTTIDGEDRTALILKPTNDCIDAPILFVFHGRGGTAQGSHSARKFHNEAIMDNMYIVYCEGTNYDNRNPPSNGWVIRFPHILTECDNKDKDLKYLQAIIDHLELDDKADTNNMGAVGFSNGGFFTLSLAQVWTGVFKGFASVGSYSSYAPASILIDCAESYTSAVDQNNSPFLNAQIAPNPAPTLYVIGTMDATLHSNNLPLVYKEDCNKFSLFQNSILQLCIKNNSVMPDCDAENFMTTYSRQIFPADTGGEETQVEVYEGDHSWPPDANKWVGEYFADLLLP